MKRYFFGKIVLVLLLVFSIAGIGGAVAAQESSLNPQIEVLPGLNVEVGEEVFFSGESTTLNGVSGSDPLIKGGRFGWDFGDGYALQPTTESGYSGLTTVHYFMNPGTYTVTLTVSVFDPVGGVSDPAAIPVEVKSTSVQVVVTGEAAIEGFELLHATFNARIAQFITAKIPMSVTSVGANSLTVTVEDENGNVIKTLVNNKTGLQHEEKFLLEQRSLPRGNYRLVASLKDAGGNAISVWKEKFSKNYDVFPAVGINEWNAICKNGEPYFPVTIYQANKDNFDMYKQEDICNSTFVIGNYPSTVGYTPDSWVDYLDRNFNQGWMSIGPGRGIAASNYRNTSCNKIKSYVNASKNHDALLMWAYKDEPNANAKNRLYIEVPPSVLAAWTYATKLEDPNHPVTINMYGLDWLPYYYAYTKARNYPYKDSKPEFGGKNAFFVDVLSMDVYPLEFRTHASLKNKPDNGVIDLWVQSIDNFIEWDYNLIPHGIFIESTDVNANNTPAPTHKQVLMEAWLAVAHGAKQINWFQHHVEGSRQYDAMNEFNTSMKMYGKIILGPDNVAQTTDDSNVRTNRVDTLTRKDGDDTYLFAVRLTEPEPLDQETNHQAPGKKEPDSITTTFTVPGIVNGHADVLNISGETIGVLEVVNGQFSDVFGKEDYRIYRISEGSPEGNAPAWFKIVDDMTVNVGSNLAFTVSATNPGGAQLTYTASNLPQGSSFDPETCTFSWTPQVSQTGTYNVTFTVTDGVNPPVGKTIKIHAVVGLESIAITTLPAKTTYLVGETLDLSGLVVTGTYSDNSTAVLNITKDNISGFDSSMAVTGKSLTVTYKFHTVTFNINVVTSYAANPVLTGPDTIQSESEFTETLGLHNTKDNVYAATFSLSYDSNLFTLNSVHSVANSPAVIAAQDVSEPGIIRLSVVSTTPIYGDNVPLVDLLFKSKVISASQTTSVRVTGTELGIADGSEYDAGTSSLATRISLRASAEVSNVAVVKGAGQVTITWTEPEDVLFKGVKIICEGDTTITPVQVNKGVQTATINGLTTGSTYSFRVIALNSEDLESQGVAVTVTFLAGDLNGDGQIRTGDLAMAAARYGAHEGDVDWTTARIADVVADGVVDIKDLAYIARRILNIE